MKSNFLNTNDDWNRFSFTWYSRFSRGKKNVKCFPPFTVWIFQSFWLHFIKKPYRERMDWGVWGIQLGWLVWHTDDAPLRFAILIPCVVVTSDMVQDVATIPQVQSTFKIFIVTWRNHLVECDFNLLVLVLLMLWGWWLHIKLTFTILFRNQLLPRWKNFSIGLH